MKILQIIDSLQIGGAERVCVEISNLLYQKKYDISVLTITSKGEMTSLLNPKIEVNCLKRTSKIDFKTYSKFCSIIKEYDILHVHMRHTYRYVKLILNLFRIDKKIIFHDHYGKIDVDKKPPFLFASFFFKPTYYIGVSQELTDWAVNVLKLVPSTVFLLENIISKQKCQKQEKFENEAVLVANIKNVKNQLFAIKLIEITTYNLTIYGNIDDVAYYESLILYIKTKKLEKRITFIHHEKNIQAVIGKYKFALHAAKSESGPLVLIEYLAQGIPFLSYNTGQVAVKLKNELPDSFIHNFDLKLWCQQLKIIEKSDSTLLNKLYFKHFSSENYIQKCLNIYQHILNSY